MFYQNMTIWLFESKKEEWLAQSRLNLLFFIKVLKDSLVFAIMNIERIKGDKNGKK